MEYPYPSILRRYFATFLDGLFVLATIILFAYVFQFENEMMMRIRVSIVLFMFFVYEPLCTSLFCTIGQKLTGIRIRTWSTQRKISIPKAYLRILAKLVMGLISFFTIPFSKDKRAIHDYVVGSIVICKRKQDA